MKVVSRNASGQVNRVQTMSDNVDILLQDGTRLSLREKDDGHTLMITTDRYPLTIIPCAANQVCLRIDGRERGDK